MHADSRAVLARLAYLRALAAARVAPTPRRWRKLVTAGKNLRAANGERERQWLATLPPAARKLATLRPRGARGAVLLPFPAGPERWAEVIREWERARALMAWSERLVAQSRALCAALAEESGRRLPDPERPARAGRSVARSGR